MAFQYLQCWLSVKIAGLLILVFVEIFCLYNIRICIIIYYLSLIIINIWEFEMTFIEKTVF